MMMDEGTLFIIIFGGSVILTFTFIVMWHVFHIILCKKYDDLLFREPYFRITELEVYSSWPLGLFRSMEYIVLLAVPSIATKRRFKNVVLDRSNVHYQVLFCKLFLLICVLNILFILGIVIGGVVA